jgi:hypothetical protein
MPYLTNSIRRRAMKPLNLKHHLIWIACVFCLMGGCASGKRPMLDLEPPLKIQAPASLAQAPQALPPASSGRLVDLESNHRAVAKAYHRLASQVCNLLLFLEQAPDACAPWLQDLPD